MIAVGRILVVTVLCCFSLPGMAGGSAMKERNSCIGAYQAWNFTWTYYPDVYEVYSAHAKKESESSFHLRKESPEARYCYFVGFGTPFGSVTHEWKAAAWKPSSTLDTTNSVFFVQGDPCKSGILD